MSETVLPVFTKEMKATHTILVPKYAAVSFCLLRSRAAKAAATKPKILQNTGRNRY